MASSSQNGIQLLLAAEQEAQDIVNAARNVKKDIYARIYRRYDKKDQGCKVVYDLGSSTGV